jgi:outer membrane usher protein
MKASPEYTVVNARPIEERSATEASLFGSVAVGRQLSLTTQHSHAELRGGLTRSRSALLATVNLPGNMQLSASAARLSDETGRSREVFVGLSMLFGRTTAGVSLAQNRNGRSVGVDAQRPVPVGEGYGYQVRAESGSPGTFSGAARYQGRHGRYEVRRDVIGGDGSTSATIAGSVVAIGGGVFASRPVQQSFALVQVPGVEGVRGFASNQEVGRTNSAGNLLVPDLQPYYGNLLNIADSDIPLDYSVNGVKLTLAVPFRGGALAVFPVQLIRRVTGTIRIGEALNERTPEYGEIRVSAAGVAEPIVSPIGGTGEFYFENLAPGRHAATVQDDKGSCEFVLDVPTSAESLVDLGTIRCMSQEAQ